MGVLTLTCKYLWAVASAFCCICAISSINLVTVNNIRIVERKMKEKEGKEQKYIRVLLNSER